MSRAALFALIAALAGADAAQAGSAEDALHAAVLAPRAAISRPGDAPNARIVLAYRDAEDYALRRAGIARTSVSETEDEITRSLGFLCGIQPGQKPTGAAAARGYDTSGRFLGAQLRVALK
ncbi:hypothetical protein [uncultured Phenylobacterium sp.]|uniref:hypothetical protein n=1 Tax=uncultured Phenylobacterium sp. TaxID=349273 RepID=UPI0025F78F5C|nr:hypothetical protein [uncultured Phenylobacterium sp.]